MIPKKPDVKQETDNGRGGSYDCTAEDAKWITDQIKANGGAFSLPFDQAKGLFNYKGGAKFDTWVANAQLHVESRKHNFHIGVRDKNTRVAFKQGKHVPKPKPANGETK